MDRFIGRGTRVMPVEVIGIGSEVTLIYQDELNKPGVTLDDCIETIYIMDSSENNIGNTRRGVRRMSASTALANALMRKKTGDTACFEVNDDVVCAKINSVINP